MNVFVVEKTLIYVWYTNSALAKGMHVGETSHESL